MLLLRNRRRAVPRGRGLFTVLMCSSCQAARSQLASRLAEYPGRGDHDPPRPAGRAPRLPRPSPGTSGAAPSQAAATRSSSRGTSRRTPQPSTPAGPPPGRASTCGSYTAGRPVRDQATADPRRPPGPHQPVHGRRPPGSRRTRTPPAAGVEPHPGPGRPVPRHRSRATEAALQHGRRELAEQVHRDIPKQDHQHASQRHQRHEQQRRERVLRKRRPVGMSKSPTRFSGPRSRSAGMPPMMPGHADGLPGRAPARVEARWKRQGPGAILGHRARPLPSPSQNMIHAREPQPGQLSCSKDGCCWHGLAGAYLQRSMHAGQSSR